MQYARVPQGKQKLYFTYFYIVQIFEILEIIGEYLLFNLTFYMYTIITDSISHRSYIFILINYFLNILELLSSFLANLNKFTQT